MWCYRLGPCSVCLDLTALCRCLRVIAWRLVCDLSLLVALAALASLVGNV